MERQSDGERKRNKQKNTQKGGGCDSQQTWTLKSEMRGGGVLEAQSPAYTTVPAGKRRYFSLRLNPYGLLFRGTGYVFCLSLDTAYFSKATLDLIERSGVDRGYTREKLSREGSIR